MTTVGTSQSHESPIARAEQAEQTPWLNNKHQCPTERRSLTGVGWSGMAFVSSPLNAPARAGNHSV